MWCQRWVVIVLLVAAGVAQGAPPDPGKDEARRLFKDGNKRMDAGDFTGALTQFDAAWQLWKNAKILLNMAAVQRKLGRRAEAAETYLLWRAAPDAEPKRQREVEAIVAALDAEIARVRVWKSDPALQISLDGRAMGDTSRELLFRVEPGPHALLAEDTQGRTAALQVTLVAGELHDAEFVFAAIPEPPTTGPLPALPATPAPSVDPAPSVTTSVTAGPARPTKATWPQELSRRPVTLAPRMLEAQLMLALGASPSYTNGRPTALVPRLFVGISDRVTVGVASSRGLCFGDEASNCPAKFNDFSIEALYAPGQGRTFAVHAMVDDPTLKQSQLGVELGIQARLSGRRLAVFTNPRVRFGLSARENGNQESLALPARLEIQAAPRVAVLVGVEFLAPIDQLSDYMQLIVAGGVQFTFTRALDVVARLSFDDLPLGQSGRTTSSDFRTFELAAVSRF